MDDGGITLTGLTIGGAALTTIGGLLGAYFKTRYARTEIRPQPLGIREEKQPLAREACDTKHQTLNEQVRELFVRTVLTEQSVAELKGLKDQVRSMDGKLDIIIRNMKGSV